MGHISTANGWKPFSFRFSLIISVVLKVSSDTMMASMFSSFMVGPKGSVSYTKSSSMSGLIVLMNSLASCILISKDWMIS
jgi:hypothetical protein